MPGASDFSVVDVTLADRDENDKIPQRDRIIDAVLNAGVTFWRDRDGVVFCTVPLNGTMRRYRVRTNTFALIVRQLYGAASPVETKRGVRPGSVSDSSMREVTPALEACALTSPVRDPEIRVLVGNDNAVWLDLGDDAWRAVRITDEGWTIVDHADVPLIRSNGMRPLAVPVPEQDPLRRLRELLNIGTGDAADASFRLIVAWLLATLYPRGPYPILAVDGEQGSGKTTTCQMLRRLVVPNAANLRAMPRCEDDLLIAAANGRVVAFDNVSSIEANMADALCRLATGSGFGKRRLYTDGGEVIISVARPVLLNGIPALLGRGDLADRSIAVTVPPIPDAMRRPEVQVWAEFDAAAPGVLATLLDGMVMALRNLPRLQLPSLPRMADFARLACAAAPAFDWSQDQMLDALFANREAAVATVIESDPLAEAVRSIAGQHVEWTGTATRLMEMVNKHVSADVQRERGWPRDAARLGTRLRRVAPALRRAAVEVVWNGDGGTGQRTMTIRRMANSINRDLAVTAVTAVVGEDFARVRSGDSDSNTPTSLSVPSQPNAQETVVCDRRDGSDSNAPCIQERDGDEVVL